MQHVICECCKEFCHSGAATLPTAFATSRRRHSTLPSRTRSARSLRNVQLTATWWSSVRISVPAEQLVPCLFALFTRLTSASHVWRMTHSPRASRVASASSVAWPMSTWRRSSPMVSAACTAASSYHALALLFIVAASSASTIRWSPSCLERMQGWSFRSC